MGGVPTLLLVIAFGITYGWQPDREGGVEYIIQVPPDQVERLETVGEITSVIDPEVRGHVSRVIIRVGSGTVPKETPPNLVGRSAASGDSVSSLLAADDHSPLPIPAMGDAGLADQVSMYGQSVLAGQAVMKPDANSPPPSSGFGFPGLPPTLQAAPPQIDQAGREVPGTVASPAMGSQTSAIPGSTPPPMNAPATANGVRVPPPATRTPSATSVATPPPFTGNDPQGNYARARAGGPSTDPTNSRDSTWQDFPPSATTAVNSNPSSSGMNQASPFSSSSSGYSAPTTGGGLAPSDTYGRFPSGFSFSTTGQQASGNTAPGYGSASPSAAAYGANATSATSSNPGTPFAASQGYGVTATQTVPDPRLTPVQVAAGAWSIDAYGRILDRQGRVLNGISISQSPNAAASSTGFPQSNPASGQGFQGGNGSSVAYGNGGGQTGSGFAIFGSGGDASSTGINSSLGQPTASGPAFSAPAGPRAVDRTNPSMDRGLSSDAGSVRPAGGSMIFGDRDAIRGTSGEWISDADRPSTSLERRGDPPSLSDRGTALDSAASVSRPEVATSQPLVNGLLLISLVANVYLVFWLKNLRIQFRDLVAAKRMAGSNSA